MNYDRVFFFVHTRANVSRLVSRLVAGLMVLQTGSFFTLIEAAAETVIALLRAVEAEVNRQGGGRITDVRIVGFTEDCPRRVFGPWSYRSVVLPPEAGAESSVEAEPPVTQCSSLFRSIMQVGAHMMDGLPQGQQVDMQAVLDQLQERWGSFLPSDERLQAMAASDRVRLRNLFARAHIPAALAARLFA